MDQGTTAASGEGSWDPGSWVFPRGPSPDWERARAVRLERLRELAAWVRPWEPLFPELELGRAARNILDDPTESALRYPGFDWWKDALPPTPVRHPGPYGQSTFTHLEQLHGYALGAALRSGQATRFQTRLGADGDLCLRGTGTWLELGPAWAERRVWVAVEGGELGVAEDPAGLWVRPELRAFERVGSLEINDRDGIFVPRICGGEGAARHHDRRACLDTLAAALALIEEVDPVLHAELCASVAVIVPMRRPRPRVQTSATSRILRGVLGVGDHPDTLQVAEVLVHEFCHDKLHLLDALSPVHEGGDIRARYWSPWRPEPRPLRGIFDGAHAFLGVTGFYQGLARRVGAGADEVERLRHEAAIQAWRTEHALGTLAIHGRLSALGRELLAEMWAALGRRFEAMEGWPAELLEETRRAVAADARVGTRWPGRLHREVPAEVGAGPTWSLDLHGAETTKATTLDLSFDPAKMDEAALEALRVAVRARLEGLRGASTSVEP